jgi:hypothetical protein
VPSESVGTRSSALAGAPPQGPGLRRRARRGPVLPRQGPGPGKGSCDSCPPCILHHFKLAIHVPFTLHFSTFVHNIIMLLFAHVSPSLNFMHSMRKRQEYSCRHSYRMRLFVCVRARALAQRHRRRRWYSQINYTLFTDNSFTLVSCTNHGFTPISQTWSMSVSHTFFILVTSQFYTSLSQDGSRGVPPKGAKPEI